MMEILHLTLRLLAYDFKIVQALRPIADKRQFFRQFKKHQIFGFFFFVDILPFAQ